MKRICEILSVLIISLNTISGWAQQAAQPVQQNTTATAVDLGLSVKWADRNVGAAAPERYGNYYAWGEVATKIKYVGNAPYEGIIGDYIYFDKTTGKCLEIGEEISGKKYDVAHVKWGGQWRMPTKAEMIELLDNCTWKWTTRNNVKGCLVTGPNGNTIFLPAAGYKNDGNIAHGQSGLYWTGTYRDTGDYPNPVSLDFCPQCSGYTTHFDRCCGLTIRAVCD